MWYPVKITFSGLFSFRDEATVDFKRGECTVIFGDNQTDRGVLNNGAGKSTLFEAIALALTGDLLPRDTPITRDKAINRDKNEATVEMHLANDVLHKTMTICRTFYRKKSARAVLYEDDVLNTELTSVAEVDKRVLELLGLSRDDLLHYYIISQDRQYNFLIAPDSVKKEILNRITNADRIQPVIDGIKEDLKLATKRTEEAQGELAVLDERIATLEENIAEAKKNSAVEAQIAQLIDSTVALLGDMENAKKTARDIEVEVTAAKAEKQKLERQIAEAPDVSAELERLEQEINTLKRRKKALAKETQDAEMELEGAITCPHCGKEFIVEGSGKTMKELQGLIAQNKKEEPKVKVALEKATTEYETIEETAYALEQRQKALRRVEQNLGMLKSRADRVKGQITSIHEQRERLLARVETLRKTAEKDETIVNFERKIAEARKKRTALVADLKDYRYLVESLKYWDYYMGKSGFLTYLANKAIGVIEGMTNRYLEKFGLDVTVLINGFTVLKDGSVREKIDVYLQSDGLTADVYGIHSGAERGRVALASLIGLNRLINMATDGRGLDMLLLDEAFHGIDSMGQEHIIRTLENVGMTSMMITQNVAVDFPAKNKLIVRKVDRVSQYV